MKLASTISRYLLGLLFAVFGSNGFLHFITPPPPATQFAGQFMGAAFGSHFMALIFLFQLVGGLLLLSGFYVPLALVILAGVIINILDYHLTMDAPGIPPAIIATILWFITAAGYRQYLAGLFVSRTSPAG